MDGLDEFLQLVLLHFRQRARLLVPAREVDVHIGGHGAIEFYYADVRARSGAGKERSCARVAGSALGLEDGGASGLQANGNGLQAAVGGQAEQLRISLQRP